MDMCTLCVNTRGGRHQVQVLLQLVAMLWWGGGGGGGVCRKTDEGVRDDRRENAWARWVGEQGEEEWVGEHGEEEWVGEQWDDRE